ncbi:MAG TPA: hypothetical protein VFI43_01490 [Nitrosospira sp.]|nr:hypothetical protein [Nitrosospira sp.]
MSIRRLESGVIIINQAQVAPRRGHVAIAALVATTAWTGEGLSSSPGDPGY